MTEASFCYSIFGLRVRSEFALVEVPEDPSGGTFDVTIRRGPVGEADSPPGAYSVQADGTLLNLPGTARMLLREGREIVIDAPEASDRKIRTYLLGSAFGALLHQRGLMPLHANAIDIGGKAVAFAGHSGAGKSTLAAWFHDRGYEVLADDVCVIGWEGDMPVVQPGIPRLRLWREALEATGRSLADYERSFEDTDKYDVPTVRRARKPLRLDKIYFLQVASDKASGPTISALPGTGGVAELVSNTYRGAYLAMIGRTGEHLMQCVRIAREVPLFRAEREWGLEGFDEQARRLEEHAIGFGPGLASSNRP
jgi:hypothetical protein